MKYLKLVSFSFFFSHTVAYIIICNNTVIPTIEDVSENCGIDEYGSTFCYTIPSAKVIQESFQFIIAISDFAIYVTDESIENAKTGINKINPDFACILTCFQKDELYCSHMCPGRIKQYFILFDFESKLRISNATFDRSIQHPQLNMTLDLIDQYRTSTFSKYMHDLQKLGMKALIIILFVKYCCCRCFSSRQVRQPDSVTNFLNSMDTRMNRE